MQRPEFNLSDYWRVIRRRKFIIVVSTIVVGGIVFYRSSTSTPLYQTSATVMVEKGAPITSGAQPYYTPFEGDFIDTQTTIIRSEPVAEEAAKLLGWVSDQTPTDERKMIVGGIMGSIGASKVRITNLIDISATADDAKKAADIANGVARGYQLWSLKNRNEQARTVRTFVEGQLGEVKKRLAEAEDALKEFKESSEEAGAIVIMQQRLAGLELDLASLLQDYTEKHPDIIDVRAQIAEIKDILARHPGLELKLTQLSRAVQTNAQLHSLLNQRFEEARIAEAEKISGVTVVSPARVPGGAISPRTKSNTMIAVVVGLLLGLVTAFVKENLDTSIATIEEVEDFLQIPILGVIPEIETQSMKIGRLAALRMRFFKGILAHPPILPRREARKLLVLLGETKSPNIEAYKTLRTNIHFAVSQSSHKVLMFTSSGSREGKTVTAANYAMSLAQDGQKVLLISADLRRGRIGELFGLRSEPGLSEVITGDMDWRRACRTIEDLMVGELDTAKLLDTPGIDNLSILTDGKKPPNPAEFLHSSRMKNLLKEAREEFDYVILDCPPVLPVSDALVLAPDMDGVVFVYQSGQTARGALKRAKTLIAASGAKILGVVLNGIKASEMKLAPTYRYYGGYYGDKYGYGYVYGEEEPSEEKKKSRSWWPFGKKEKA